VIRPFYRSFFGTAREGEDALARDYLLPNRAFFRPYVAFMTQGEMGWEDFVREFSGRWAGSPEDVLRLSVRMTGYDVDVLATQAVSSAVRVLGSDVAQAEVYLCGRTGWKRLLWPTYAAPQS
jgi:hypothetical protein